MSARKLKAFAKSSKSDLFESLIYFQVEPIDQLHFATASNDNIVKIFEMPEMFVVAQHTSMSYVYALLWTGEILYAGNGSGELEILNKSLELQDKLRVHDDLITQICLSQKQIITASVDTFIKIVDPVKKQTILSIQLTLPVWGFLTQDEHLYVPLLRNSVILKREAQGFQVQKTLGGYCQMVQLEKGDMYGLSTDFKQIENLKTGEIMREDCHAIGQFGSQLIRIDDKVLRIGVKQATLDCDSPVRDNYTVYCMKQVGRFLIVATDIGHLSSYVVE